MPDEILTGPSLLKRNPLLGIFGRHTLALNKEGLWCPYSGNLMQNLWENEGHKLFEDSSLLKDPYTPRASSKNLQM